MSRSPENPVDNYANYHSGKMAASATLNPASGLEYYENSVPVELQQHPRILNALSRIYSQYLHNFEKAKELLVISLKKNPSDVVTRTMLAQVLFRQGYGALARHLLLQVLDRDPENISAHILLAHWALDNNQSEVASVLIEAIAKIDPNNSALLKLRRTLAGSQKQAS